MNYWKYIVMSLLGACMVFHLTAIYYISGRNFELTSSDYYAQEQVYQQTLERLRVGRDWTLQHRFDGPQRFQVALQGPHGHAPIQNVTISLKRPNGAAADLTLTASAGDNGWWSADLVAPLPRGNWGLFVDVTSDDAVTPLFRQKLRID